MRPQPNREADKTLLTNLSNHLNTSLDRLRVDECGDWNIFGRKGYISTDSELWYIYTGGSSKRHWTAIKKKLFFMVVSQDGDDEGVLKLERMPSQEEAEVIRKVLGLNKRPDITEENRAKLVERGLKIRKEGVS